MTAFEFKTLFDEHRMRVFFFCMKLVDNTQDAEDITIQVFTKLWENRDKIERPSIKAFLMIAAKNKCLDYIRSKSFRDRSLNLYPREEEIELLDIKVEVLTYIYNLIEKLPPIQKKLFKMRFVDGLKSHEIAAILNQPPSTIRNMTNRAIHKISEALKNRGITYHG